MYMSLRAAFAFCLLAILPPGGVFAEPGAWRPPAADNVTLVSLHVRGDRALVLGVTRAGYETRGPVRAYWLSLAQPLAPRLLAALALPDYYDEIAADETGLMLWSHSGGAVAFVSPSADETRLVLNRRVALRGLSAPAEPGEEPRSASAIWQVQRSANRLWVRSDVGLFALDLQNEARVLARLDEGGAFLVQGALLYRAARSQPDANGESAVRLEIRNADRPDAPALGAVALPGFCCATRIVVKNGVALVVDIEMRRSARLDVRNPAAPRALLIEDAIEYFDLRPGAGETWYALRSPYGESVSLWQMNFADGPIAGAQKEYGPRLDHRGQFGVHAGRVFVLTDTGELRVLSPR